MLLAIDTCGASGGLALGRAAGSEFKIAAQRTLAGKTYSELLLSTVAELLREAQIAPGDLTGVAVVHGPGSFTGIRIGLSAAKGLAEGLGLPVVALSRMELLARTAPGGDAAAVLDAGRGEFYSGFYRNGVCELEAVLAREALEDAIPKMGLPLIVTEPHLMEALGALKPELAAAPSAAEALRLGWQRFRAGAFDDVASLDANYLRRSETEMLARIAEHAALRGARQRFAGQRNDLA